MEARLHRLAQSALGLNNISWSVAYNLNPPSLQEEQPTTVSIQSINIAYNKIQTNDDFLNQFELNLFTLKFEALFTEINNRLLFYTMEKLRKIGTVEKLKLHDHKNKVQSKPIYPSLESLKQRIKNISNQIDIFIIIQSD